mmetsp:Transcript_688/g.1599  ORF Transcript_688/g.1599 Transcript_688/m.1599 type:complete len:86 (-) Transcript_688:200-457(-)
MATGSLERLPLTPTSMLKQFTLLPAATHSTDVGVRGFVKQSVSCSKVCLCVIANLNSLQLFSRAFSLVQICQLSPHFPCLQNRET